MRPIRARETGKGFFYSVIAREVFFLFFLCALLPMSILAYFTYSHFTKQLYRQTYGRISTDTRSAGMAVIERLVFLETDIKMALGEFKSEFSSLDLINHRFSMRLTERFIGLAMVNHRNEIIDVFGNVKNIPMLNPKQEQHIKAGKTLVTAIWSGDDSVDIHIVRSSATRQPDSKRLYGVIEPQYLWGVKDYLPPLTGIAVLDADGGMIYSSLQAGAIDRIITAMKTSSEQPYFSWNQNEEVFLASYWDIFIYPQFLTNWKIILSQSKAAILGPLKDFMRTFQLIVMFSFIVVLFLSVQQIRRRLLPVKLLQDATQRITNKDFSHPLKIETRDEFRELGESFNDMAANIENHFDVMAQINRIGLALSIEKDAHKLMETIVAGAKRITNADGGVLYFITDDRQLKKAIICIDSLDFMANGTDLNPISLVDETGAPNKPAIVSYCLKKGTTINIPDIYSEVGFDLSGDHEFDQKMGYRSQSVLCIPMKDHENEMIGVLQLINARDTRTVTLTPFSEEDQKIAETIASQAAVALTKNKLIDDFKELFDSLVKLIATAIDEKSPYTGNHCKGVPKLTMRLAEAVCHANQRPFKDITFSEEALYELKIASLLHDCGKVTTPVHIMDKATKLETILDRIELIDTRFEIIKRDLQIELLQKKIDGLDNDYHANFTKLEEEVNHSRAQIDSDLSFLRSCNTVKIFMTEAFHERVSRIANRYSWVNAKGEKKSILSEDEINNLRISKGTITADERKVLDYHIVATIKMLESLSYPKSLRNVL